VKCGIEINILTPLDDAVGRALAWRTVCHKRVTVRKRLTDASASNGTTTVLRMGHPLRDSLDLSDVQRSANSMSMNPIRREMLNGLLVLVVASLMSVAFSAFQVSFNALLWVLILMGIAIAVSGYILFEITLGVITSAEDREKASAESTRLREEEWLKRVGTPARLELGLAEGSAGIGIQIEAVKTMKPGSDLTAMLYVDREGGGSDAYLIADQAREQFYASIMEQLRSGVIRDYKRLICFDHEVLANDPELMSGVLKVGEGPGTISKRAAEDCRLMLETPRCFVYVAQVVMRNYFIALYGTDKALMTVDTFVRETGSRSVLGVMLFHDPPNGEIVEQFRQMERATERRMVAVHTIRFPEDAEPTAELATR
jgi:hypothetical protein